MSSRHSVRLRNLRDLPDVRGGIRDSFPKASIPDTGQDIRSFSENGFSPICYEKGDVASDLRGKLLNHGGYSKRKSKEASNVLKEDYKLVKPISSSNVAHTTPVAHVMDRLRRDLCGGDVLPKSSAVISHIQPLRCVLPRKERRAKMRRDIGIEAKASSEPKDTVKAKWSNAVHEIFVDVCLEETVKGNKPGACFNREGWQNVEENFYENSGLRYDRKQLKNHWDLTKGQWKTWSKLVNTSSMGWDPNTQTFAASEDDWANYIQANPDAAQYRFKVPLLVDKLSIIFDGTTYSEDTQATPLPAKRRKVSNSSTTTPLLPSNEVIEATPISQNDYLFDAVESKSIITQSSQGKLTYSIGECIECLDGMGEIEPGSDLYLFALDIFLKKEFREVFLQLKKPSVRVSWLRRMQSSGPPLPLH